MKIKLRTRLWQKKKLSALVLFNKKLTEKMISIFDFHPKIKRNYMLFDLSTTVCLFPISVKRSGLSKHPLRSINDTLRPSDPRFGTPPSLPVCGGHNNCQAVLTSQLPKCY